MNLDDNPPVALEEIEPPAWHEEILRKRLEKIKGGTAVWHDLDQAFDDLRKERVILHSPGP